MNRHDPANPLALSQAWTLGAPTVARGLTVVLVDHGEPGYPRRWPYLAEIRIDTERERDPALYIGATGGGFAYEVFGTAGQVVAWSDPAPEAWSEALNVVASDLAAWRARLAELRAEGGDDERTSVRAPSGCEGAPLGIPAAVPRAR